MPVWQVLHAAVACTPVSLKPVVAWSKLLRPATVILVSAHVLVEWHEAQAVPNLPKWTCGSAWQETHVWATPL
ncbi:hypothetical protein AYO44_10050 [Planctomycetaceae bacterium SCGC AG-212-F19]|nr:hypothetical protein AYO44_10050 [Planctomycetaceae bacterium SCGC AG-212-F19]